MTSEYIPRASLDLLQPGLVDAELKSLKLLCRRLQSSLTTLGSELQLLRRLYYKNKNQHRGALFWRNVSELQRYLHKLEDLNVQEPTLTLRNTFYGPTASSSSMKGTWTHCPSHSYLSKIAKQYQVATKLLNKLSEVCLRAYRSFHRSLQSAAFLQILLLFVAISSRTQSLSQELEKIVQDIRDCTERLISVIFLQPKERDGNLSNIKSTSMFVNVIAVDTLETTPPVPIDKVASNPVYEAVINPPEKPTQNVAIKISAIPTENVIIERKAAKKASNEIEQSQRASTSISRPKKKRKVARNEIDDIFGF